MVQFCLKLFYEKNETKKQVSLTTDGQDGSGLQLEKKKMANNNTTQLKTILYGITHPCKTM